MVKTWKWQIGQVLYQKECNRFWKVVAYYSDNYNQASYYDLRKCSATGLEYKALGGHLAEAADKWEPVTISKVGEKASTEGMQTGILKRRLKTIIYELGKLEQEKVEIMKKLGLTA